MLDQKYWGKVRNSALWKRTVRTYHMENELKVHVLRVDFGVTSYSLVKRQVITVPYTVHSMAINQDP